VRCSGMVTTNRRFAVFTVISGRELEVALSTTMVLCALPDCGAAKRSLRGFEYRDRDAAIFLSNAFCPDVAATAICKYPRVMLFRCDVAQERAQHGARIMRAAMSAVKSGGGRQLIPVGCREQRLGCAMTETVGRFGTKSSEREISRGGAQATHGDSVRCRQTYPSRYVMLVMNPRPLRDRRSCQAGLVVAQSHA